MNCTASGGLRKSLTAPWRPSAKVAKRVEALDIGYPRPPRIVCGNISCATVTVGASLSSAITNERVVVPCRSHAGTGHGPVC